MGPGFTRTYVYMHMYVYIYIHGCGSQPVLSRGSPPLLQTFVAGPLLQTLVADLCVEYCSLQGACRGGVCRGTPLSVTILCRKMAAQACYKANVFDSLPYMYASMCVYTWGYLCCKHICEFGANVGRCLRPASMRGRRSYHDRQKDSP